MPNLGEGQTLCKPNEIIKYKSYFPTEWKAIDKLPDTTNNTSIVEFSDEPLFPYAVK